jgi:predicted NAD/FAD-binding protein
MNAPGASKTSVIIVGSGAAGISAAWNLSQHPDQFEVEVWEKSEIPGGVATSKELDDGLYINDGVQGGSPMYHNTINLMERVDMHCSPVKMKFSFGQGENAWNNTKPSLLQRKFKSEIARFGTVIKIVDTLKFIFAFVPIWIVMKLFLFSDEFASLMVYPLIALFFGTGNQSDRVSTTLVTQIFENSEARMFDYDKELMVSEPADMIAFPKLGEFYKRLQEQAEKRGSVKFYYNRHVEQIIRHSNSTVTVISQDGQKKFDRIILACDAENALKTLDKPSLLERIALGNVEYYNDLTITHEDISYMNSKNDVSLFERNDQYFIHQYSPKSSLMEMSFNLTNYQPQLKGNKRKIFQTIFLNDKVRDQWTIDEIRKEKIIAKTWWRQFAHCWKHFVITVPLIRFIQASGYGTTFYCGAYTMANLHEIAVISGFAAAKRLGASYPFKKDKKAYKYFDLYYKVCHKLW